MTNKMIKRPETRIEVITSEGRQFVAWGIDLYESIQDNGRTVKFIVKERNTSINISDGVYDKLLEIKDVFELHDIEDAIKMLICMNEEGKE